MHRESAAPPFLMLLLLLSLAPLAAAGEAAITLVTKSGVGTIKADRAWEENDFLCWERWGERDCLPKDQLSLESPAVLSAPPRTAARTAPRQERPGKPAVEPAVSGEAPVPAPPVASVEPPSISSSISSTRPPMLLPSRGLTSRGRSAVPCATIRSADGTTTQICSEEPRAKASPRRKPKSAGTVRSGEPVAAKPGAGRAGAAKAQAGPVRERAQEEQGRSQSRPQTGCASPTGPERRC
jgi:hypothetical protein